MSVSSTDEAAAATRRAIPDWIDGVFVAILAGAVALWFGPSDMGRYGTYVLSLWLVMSVAVMGLNLTLGYAGLKSLAQAAFMGIGAYTTALLTTKAGAPWLVAFAASGALCFVIGLLLGFPALRVKAHYLAFVTLAFSTLVWLILRNEQWLTGGVFGLSNIPRPVVLGHRTDGALAFHRFVVIVTLILSLALWWLIRSPWGRAFMALRENPSAGRKPRHRHPRLHAARLCDWIGLCGLCRRALRAARRVHRSESVLAIPILLPAADGGRRWFRTTCSAPSSARCWELCCRNGFA